MTGMRRWMTAAVAAAVVAGGTTACGGGDESPGDGDGVRQTVKIGGIFDLSGETADIGTPYADGIKGFVEYWNQAGDGPEIELTSEDYKYKTELAEGLFASLEREGVVALQGWGTGDTEALTDEVTADRIPFMSASSADSLTKPSRTPFNFVAATSYAGQMRIALRWIREQASGAEVASFHQASPFGRSPQKPGARTARRLGLGFEPYEMRANDKHNRRQLRLARSRGAKFVVIQNTSIPAARLAKDIANLRLDVKIVCLNWCADELFIELAGDGADGTVGVLPFAPPSSKADGLAAPRTFLSKRGAHPRPGGRALHPGLVHDGPHGGRHPARRRQGRRDRRVHQTGARGDGCVRHRRRHGASGVHRRLACRHEGGKALRGQERPVVAAHRSAERPLSAPDGAAAPINALRRRRR